MAKTIEQQARELLEQLPVDYIGTGDGRSADFEEQQAVEVTVAALLAVARDQQERDEKICAEIEPRYNNGIANECAAAIRNQKES